jgi:hypothetical protein
MSIQERRGDASQGLRWQAPRELAPSVMEDFAPVLSRWVGAFGLALIVLGGVALLMFSFGQTNRLIGPSWGTLFVVVGFGGLLFHALNESELQIRRVYMGFGFLWLALGVVGSLIPYKVAGAETATVGALFLPFGLLALLPGLLFTLAFIRNETDVATRDLASYVVGAIGAGLAATGFLGGTLSTPFLVPYGVVLIALGFLFLCSFLIVRGESDDLGHVGALAVGAVGLIFFLIALGRSVLPPLLEKLHWATPTGVNYMMPSGLLLVFGGLLYLALAAAFVSDRQLVVLTRRELGSLFFSPLAYFVILGYVALGWIIFQSFVYNALWRDDLMGGPGGPRAQLEPIVINYIISWFPVICVLILVPVLTMRLVSEEKRTGTLEMTLTAPVEETVVVVSKFLAALTFFILVWIPWGLYLVSLRVVGGAPFDFRPLLGFLVALVFTGGAFVSMGVFWSSVTRNQLIAAVLTFVGMFTLTFIFFLKQNMAETDWWRTVLTHTSYVDLWLNVLQGKLASRDLLFYLSSTVFFLFLSVKVLELRKWW